MDPLVVLGIQCTFSILVFFLIFKWYVVPKITKETKFDILVILLLVNVFRYLPLSLFMPGQVSADFPLYLKTLIAHGDFLSGILACIAMILLKTKKKAALPFTWIFSVVSSIDIVFVMTLALYEKVYELPLCANYFTVSVYVPLLMVIQVLIWKMLSPGRYQ